jgi:nitrite reductase/ring-hydroxylating ferredoxin subunit
VSFRDYVLQLNYPTNTLLCWLEYRIFFGARRKLFVSICKTSDLEDGSMNRFEVDNKLILLARAGEDFFATEASCTHEEADLSLGLLSEFRLTCPLHQAKFDIRSGEVLDGPNGTDPSSIRRLGTYPTKVEHGQVFVDI